MKSAADLIVVGGGPAGAAAAIQAAQTGLAAILIEGTAFPRHRPGETLHAGVETIFQQLGVADEISAASDIRHQSIDVRWVGRRIRWALGAGPDGAWRGYQIAREKMDIILIDRARTLGVAVMQPRRAVRPLFHGERVCGVETDTGPLRALAVIDASGRANWLQRRMRLPMEVASPPLIVKYGYCKGKNQDLSDGPLLVGDSYGWRWTAQVADNKVAWVSLAFPGDRGGPRKPNSLRTLRDIGAPRGADVTWRRIVPTAGSGYFIAGDAAAVTDPASGHGVLRALMSGMMAAYQARSAILGGLHLDEAARRFKEWVGEWWRRDVEGLAMLYRQLDPLWADARTSCGPHNPGRKGRN